MEEFFGQSFLTGIYSVIDIMMDYGKIVVTALVSLQLLKIIVEAKKENMSLFQFVWKTMKPMTLGFLMFTYSTWVELLTEGMVLFPKYLDEEFVERSDLNNKFVDEYGQAVDPWEHYHYLMRRTKEMEENKYKEYYTGNLAFDWYARHLLEETSLVGLQVQSVIMQVFDWLVEGSYVVIVIVLEKIQEVVLALVISLGILAILISFIPGREGSLDNWFTYFLSVNLWSVILIVLNVFYKASILGEIAEMERVLSEGVFVSSFDFLTHTIEYIANCISYIILFLTVPFLVQIIMSKVGGAQMFSKIVGMASAGSVMAMKYGATAARAGGLGVGGVVGGASGFMSGAKAGAMGATKAGGSLGVAAGAIIRGGQEAMKGAIRGAGKGRALVANSLQNMSI